MRKISEVAEQLRVVRQARQRFLRLWAVEQELISPGLDRVAADVDAACAADLNMTINSRRPSADK